MGANSSRYHPPSTKFHTIANYKYCHVWIRRSDRVEHMEEYRIKIQNEIDLEKYKHMFLIRINHPIFVNTLFFTHGHDEYLCGSFQRGSLLT